MGDCDWLVDRTQLQCFTKRIFAKLSHHSISGGYQNVSGVVNSQQTMMLGHRLRHNDSTDRYSADRSLVTFCAGLSSPSLIVRPEPSQLIVS